MELNGLDASLTSVHKISLSGESITLAKTARDEMVKSRNYIEAAVADGAVIYGVNTGFGALSSVRIAEKDIIDLQKNLIRSHSAGVGLPFSRQETRAIMYLRANALARGHSGVRPEVVEKILEFLNNDILPIIPSQGSVGASGDLAPLAHLALALIGEGEVWGESGPIDTEKLLQKESIKPLELKSKEGLSLINGCQVMTAVGMLAAYRAQKLCALADISGAMSLEALRGSRGPFDPEISKNRPHPGEKKTARNLIRLLGEESEISKSHLDCEKVQDAYSLRCMPAVHGAVKDTLRHAVDTLTIEANSSTDNPLVFSESKKVLSCGNFHGEPVAFQLDFLAIAMGALGNISQCRVSRLINPAFSDLPAFLAPNGGLNSGLMVVEVAAASLVSENKIYSHPASADSIATSVDKEDHVSMGTIAARKLNNVVENVANIISMEMLASTQALSLLKPLTAAAGVKVAYEFLSKKIPRADKDRFFARDIKLIKSMLDSEALLAAVENIVGELEW
ncbi:MAG: histidine ammonia-lyase [Bdellovibrionales bacterium RBG_16_40_8]|nr:MAG: histidine ammonia-lyase [Bdellovibrionales bacterium RBG_16_40_8]